MLGKVCHFKSNKVFLFSFDVLKIYNKVILELKIWYGYFGQKNHTVTSLNHTVETCMNGNELDE